VGLRNGLQAQVLGQTFEPAVQRHDCAAQATMDGLDQLMDGIGLQ